MKKILNYIRSLLGLKEKECQLNFDMEITEEEIGFDIDFNVKTNWDENKYIIYETPSPGFIPCYRFGRKYIPYTKTRKFVKDSSEGIAILQKAVNEEGANKIKINNL